MALNQFKTALLLGILTALLLWVGSFWGSSGLTFAIIFVLIMNFGSYFFSHRIVLAMYRAQPIKKSEYPWLQSMVKELAQKAGLPTPKVYLVPSDQPNAFATGRNPNNAVVACTRGILKMLDKDELRGVLAHELSHVKNRDILIQTVAATIAGIISYVGMLVRFGAIFGGLGGRDERGGGLLELLVLGIITPLLALLLQLAISRSREYLADASAAKLMKTGKPLADALLKLESASKHIPMRMGNEATSALFITNPFTAKNILSWLSTHPPIGERVKVLRGMRF